MTTAIYVFICTKTSYEFEIPPQDYDMRRFVRRVRNAFAAQRGGVLYAGDLKLRPKSDAIANHLLCDGSTKNILDFPQLFEELGTEFGGDGITTFALPDYFNDVLAVPPLTVTQTVTEGGTVSTGGTVTEPTEPGQTGGTTGGNVPSGGRPRRIDPEAQEF
jgi:Phage Tail Collar Domain